VPRQLLPHEPTKVARQLKNRTIKTVERRGKYIVIGLDKGTLVIHLRMSGRLYVRPLENEDMKYERATFDLSGKKEILVLRDPRTLGTIHYYSENEQPKSLAKLGWEPLSVKISAKELKQKFKARSIGVKVVLLDQTIYAGIGNIYASEALWVAKIHPATKANSLSNQQLTALIKAVPAVLTRALKQGGSTLRDFMSPDGDEGSYQNEFRVYGREDEPCSRCGTKIKRITQAQRSTYYCPNCQKK
jgi:formamidopyrimidine-DNA glycosylase